MVGQISLRSRLGFFSPTNRGKQLAISTNQIQNRTLPWFYLRGTCALTTFVNLNDSLRSHLRTRRPLPFQQLGKLSSSLYCDCSHLTCTQNYTKPDITNVFITQRLPFSSRNRSPTYDVTQRFSTQKALWGFSNNGCEGRPIELLFYSYEYGGEVKCLRKHVASCLASLPVQLVGAVTSLLLHQMYHCGEVTYQHTPINKYILNLIKCKSTAFMDTEFCWRYFRDRLNANRSDPLLCRWGLNR